MWDKLKLGTALAQQLGRNGIGLRKARNCEASRLGLLLGLRV
jgi:hypothetical protein